MKYSTPILLSLGYFVFNNAIAPSTIQAQITPDKSTPTNVNTKDKTTEITGGATEGGNLFHSFDEFSVPNGGVADFKNADAIDNIFSRVTGGNISNIDGAIKANNANLYLINPAGIKFGSGASLDLGGSFYGSTADSILFPNDVEFSATDKTTPTLTINAPIGLSFRDEPESIQVQGSQLSSFNTFLVGGDVIVDGGNLGGGTINLGGLSAGGTVNFTENNRLSFPDDVTLADVSLTNGSFLGIFGSTGGGIHINANNVNFTQTSTILGTGNEVDITARDTVSLNGNENGNSLIIAQVSPGTPGDAGNINIEAKEGISLNGNSLIISQVVNDDNGVGEGNAGEINLTTSSLELKENSLIIAETGGIGDTKDITLNADDVSILGNSLILNQVLENAEGNAANININANTLEVSSDVQDPSSLITQTQGKGNAGSVNIVASDSVIFDKGNIISQVGNVETEDGEITQVGNGNAGDINVTVTDGFLTLNGRSLWQASTKGEGNAGNIKIDVSGDINLNDGSLILSQVLPGGIGDAGNIEIATDSSLFAINSLIIADSKDKGNSGDISIKASDTVVLEGRSNVFSPSESTDDKLFPSQIVTGLDLETDNSTGEFISAANGTAGSIDISASQLVLRDLAFIISNSELKTTGAAGNISIKVDNLELQDNAFISTFTQNEFDGGSITVDAKTLDLISGGKIITTTDGMGNAGSINLNISDRITLDNKVPSSVTNLFFDEQFVNDIQGQNGLFANATENATGDGGNIIVGSNSVFPQEFTIANGAEVTVDSKKGRGGNVFIKSDSLTLNDGKILAATASEQGGNITLNTDGTLLLENNSLISAEALGNADGGNIDIDSEFVFALSSTGNGNDIIANAEGRGMGGNINIETQQIFNLIERKAIDNNNSNDIDASSNFGTSGTVNIRTFTDSNLQSLTEFPINPLESDAVVANSCEADSNVAQSNTFVVTGKSGTTASPFDTLNADNILLRKNSATNSNTSTAIKPLHFGSLDITPARGVIKTEDGQIILTAYPTDASSQRNVQNSSNCSDF
ncbi:MAG: hypothetical protein Tsb0014_14800 [Pleurocapsa sp.]